MKRAIAGAIAAFFATVPVAFAHGDAVHLRGTVTQINGQSITIQTTGGPAKAVTFTVADQTKIDRAGKVAVLKDLKVGDRVAVEIPKGKTEAESVKIGAAAAAKPAAKPAAERKSKG
jgi:hypothetical protein